MVKIISKERDCRGNWLIRARITNIVNEGYLEVAYLENLGFKITEWEDDRQAGCISKGGKIFLNLTNCQELKEIICKSAN